MERWCWYLGTNDNLWLNRLDDFYLFGASWQMDDTCGVLGLFWTFVIERPSTVLSQYVLGTWHMLDSCLANTLQASIKHLSNPWCFPVRCVLSSTFTKCLERSTKQIEITSQKWWSLEHGERSWVPAKNVDPFPRKWYSLELTGKLKRKLKILIYKSQNMETSFIIKNIFDTF